MVVIDLHYVTQMVAFVSALVRNQRKGPECETGSGGGKEGP